MQLGRYVYLSITTSYFDGSPYHRQVPCYCLYIIGRASLQASQQVNSCSTLASIVTAHPYVGLLCVFTSPSHYRLQKPPKRKVIHCGNTRSMVSHILFVHVSDTAPDQWGFIGHCSVALAFARTSPSPSG